MAKNMSTNKEDNFRASIRSEFRGKNVQSKVLDLINKNPDRNYMLLRTDDAFDPNGTIMEEALDNGWEFVIDDTPVQDYRAVSPDNSNEKDLRKHPLTKRGKGGAEFVVLSIDKEIQKENEKRRQEKTMARYKASSTGRSMVRKGNEMHITDSEVNESNMNKNSEV